MQKRFCETLICKGIEVIIKSCFPLRQKIHISFRTKALTTMGTKLVHMYANLKLALTINVIIFIARM